jgi:broad specificity phosphatase PhoE
MSQTTSAILIPWAQTDWHAAGRYATTTPIAINTTGVEQIESWSQLLSPQGLSMIYGPENGAGEESARQLAGGLQCKSRKVADLAEIDLGLWEGLSPDEFKKRFGKAYKQWREDPASVRAPEGEDLADTIERLNDQLRKLAGKHAGECFGAVLGPIAYAGLRCRLESRPFAELWSIPVTQPVKYFIDLEEDKATLTSECGHVS